VHEGVHDCLLDLLVDVWRQVLWVQRLLNSLYPDIADARFFTHLVFETNTLFDEVHYGGGSD
jgi:hypothetical protein